MERKKEVRRKEEEEMMDTYSRYLLEASIDRKQREKMDLERQVENAMRELDSKVSHSQTSDNTVYSKCFRSASHAVEVCLRHTKKQTVLRTTDPRP